MMPDGWNCTSSGSRSRPPASTREAERVAGVLVPPRRGAAPDAVVSAGGQDDGIRVYDVAGALFEIEPVGAEDRVAVDEQAGDVDGVENADAELRRAVDERALDLESRVVARERRTAVGVRAEEALRDAAVGFARERHPVTLEVGDAVSRPFGDDLHGVRVGEEVALLDRVSRVLLPGVFGIHRRECGVDAARRERGVGVGLGSLAEHENVRSLFGEFDRGA